MVSTYITTKYVLSQYRDKLEAEQPYLTFRFITRNERLKMEQHFRNALAIEDEAKQIEEVKAMLAVCLVGWSGYAVAYDPAKLDDVLSDMDYAELHLFLLPHLKLSEEVKKKLWLMPQSTAAPAVSDKVETASTAPAKSSP